jgi:hypothetical protein
MLKWVGTTQTLYFFIILFMSHELYKGNNIVVNGNVYPTEQAYCKEWEIPLVLQLNFTILVNGRLATLREVLPLWISEVTKELSLAHWEHWYTIVRMLAGFWYYLSDKAEYMSEADIYTGKHIYEWLKFINPVIPTK